MKRNRLRLNKVRSSQEAKSRLILDSASLSKGESSKVSKISQSGEPQHSAITSLKNSTIQDKEEKQTTLIGKNTEAALGNSGKNRLPVDSTTKVQPTGRLLDDKTAQKPPKIRQIAIRSRSVSKQALLSKILDKGVQKVSQNPKSGQN